MFAVLLRRSFSTAAAAAAAIPKPISSYTKSLNKTINKLIQERDTDKLVSCFKTCSESYRFRCRHNIFSVAVTRLAAAGRHDSIREILEFQKRFPDDFRRSEGFAARIISLYGKASMPEDAGAFFRYLPDLNCSPSVLSFNALLTACVDSKDFDRLDKEFREIPAADAKIVPDNVSYNIKIRALCEKGDLDEAFRTLDLMEGNGVSPDLISFNSLLTWFYREGRFEDVAKVWEQMGEKKIEPDIRSFNAKIDGLVLHGRTCEAVELVNELMHSGPKPDTFTFNALIKGYCQEGKLEEAKRVYADLVKYECTPNRSMFESLVPKLCELKEFDLALRLCMDSLSRKCHVNVEVLQGLVEGLVKESNINDARRLVDAGRKNGYPRKRLRIPSGS